LGVFANAISLVAGRAVPAGRFEREGRGLAGWLRDRMRRRVPLPPRLVLVERINLAPRQMLALIEADGERFLIATSPEGQPVFHPLRAAAVRRPGRAAKTAEGKSA